MTTATSMKSPDFPQRTPVRDRASGTNYSVAHLGSPSELTQYAVTHPLLKREVPGKVFLKAPLDLTAMEISYGVLPAKMSIPFYHKHQQNEEVYLILSGSGEFQVDGETFPVKQGSVVRVAPDGVRCCRNTSEEPMLHVVIQAKHGTLEQWTGTDGVGVPDAVTWPE